MNPFHKPKLPPNQPLNFETYNSQNIENQRKKFNLELEATGNYSKSRSKRQLTYHDLNIIKRKQSA